MKIILPDDPDLADDTGEGEKLKFKIRFSNWLNSTKKIGREMKQAYTIYFWQCDDNMKATLAENGNFLLCSKEKDVLTLLEILQSVTFSYRSSEAPILTMWTAKSNFI